MQEVEFEASMTKTDDIAQVRNFFGQWRRSSTRRWSKIHWFVYDEGLQFSMPRCGKIVPDDYDKFYMPPDPILTCEGCKLLNAKETR